MGAQSSSNGEKMDKTGGNGEKMDKTGGKVSVEKIERPKLAQHDSKCLDLAFAMDCTSSMGSYIDSAKANIRRIVEEIVASEKSDIRLALVEYRDHPPEDSSFVTRTHDFTGSAKTMKGWLDRCSAEGGGDEPEAVADALHDVLKLSWRDSATKICVFISDAPPHGLSDCGDQFPKGCPAGIDPMTVTHKLAEKGVTIYMVGCEPSICPYKQFFMAVAHITGGQYVPLTKAQLLSKVIIGGAQEEMSLEQLMSEVDEEVQAEISAGREIDEDEFAERVHVKLHSKGVRTKQLQRNAAALETVNDAPMAKKLSGMKSMSEVKKNFKTSETSRERFADHYMTDCFDELEMTDCFDELEISACDESMSLDGDRAMPLGRAPPAPPSMAALRHDDYNTVENDITYEQSARLVQKSLARNLAKRKVAD